MHACKPLTSCGAHLDGRSGRCLSLVDQSTHADHHACLCHEHCDTCTQILKAHNSHNPPLGMQGLLPVGGSQPAGSIVGAGSSAPPHPAGNVITSNPFFAFEFRKTVEVGFSGCFNFLFSYVHTQRQETLLSERMKTLHCGLAQKGICRCCCSSPCPSSLLASSLVLVFMFRSCLCRQSPSNLAVW